MGEQGAGVVFLVSRSQGGPNLGTVTTIKNYGEWLFLRKKAPLDQALEVADSAQSQRRFHSG